MISNHLPTDYQNFIALSRYARWKEDEQRRETWPETVSRYFDYMTVHLKKKHKTIFQADLDKLDFYIANLVLNKIKF